MTIDKGGLDYKIVSDYDPKGLAAFKADLQQVRSDIAGLKADLNFKPPNLKIDATQTTQAINQTTAAVKQQKVALSAAEQALRNYVKALEKREVKQQEANVADSAAFELERTLASSLERRRVAEAALTRIIDKRAKAQEIQNAAAERGVTLSIEEQQALGLLTKAQERLLKAKQKLADAQAASSDAELLKTKTQTRLLEEQIKAKEAAALRLARIQSGEVDPFAAPPTLGQRADTIALKAQEKESLRTLLAARGLGLDGKPLPKPPTPQELARDVVLRADQRAAIEKVLLAQGRGPNGELLPKPPPDPTIADKIKGLFGLGTEADKVEKAGSRALFTFRRLIGIFAVFAAARAVAKGFFGLIGDAISFNSEIERSVVGIAALLTAVGKVSSATGKSVSAAQSFALAQQEARKQTELLRQEAVQASVDFNGAVEAFQNAVAPGLRAGLNVDQVRQFSVQIAQAAKALGLADNQLAEEIRSILSGTIQARTTRIAVALGITNEDIRRAKELGTLADFLNSRFKAFNVVADQTGDKFEQLFARVKSAAELAIGKASVGFFEEVKGLLGDVLGLLTDSEDGLSKFKPSPEAVTIFQAIFDALKNVVAQFRELVSSNGISGLVALAQTIGAVIEAVGSALIGAVKGALTIVKAILAVFKAIGVVFGALRSLSPFDLPSLNATHQLISKILNEIILVNLTFRAIKATVLLIRPAILAVTLAVRLLGVAVITTRAGIEAAKVSAVALKVAVAETVIGLIAIAAIFAAEQLGALDFLLAAREVKLSAIDLAEKIKEAFDFRPQIEVAAESLAKFDAEMKQLTDTIKKLKTENTGTINDETLGVSFFKLDGKVLEEVRTRLQGILDLEDLLRDKRRESASIQESISSAEQQEINAKEEALLLAKESGKTSKETFESINKLKSIYDTIIEKQSQLNNLQSKSSIAEELDQAQELASRLGSLDNANRSKTTAEDVIASRKKRVQLIRDEIAALEDERKKVLSSFSDTQSQQLALAQIAGKIIDAQGRQIALNNTLSDLAAAEREQRAAINQQINEKLLLLAKEASFQLQNENLLAAARAKDAARQLEAKLAFASAAEQERIAAEGALDLLKKQQAIEAQRTADRLEALNRLIQAKQGERDSLQVEIDRLKTAADEAGVSNPQIETVIDRRASAEAAINALIEQRNGLLEQEKTLLQDAETARGDAQERLRIANIEAAQGIGALGDQISLALRRLNQELPNQFQQVFDLLKSIVDDFASFASNAIVDAFDPSKKLDLKERFGQFLQGIARQIIETLVRIATVKALLGLSNLFGFSEGGQVPPIGRARGGRTPGRRRAVGFDGGGRTPNSPHHGPRPQGLDSRDRVPIWSRVGEWFIAPERSKQVGDDFMSHLAFGPVNVDALRAAAGLLGPPSVSPATVSGGPGFAQGGFVSKDSAATQSVSAAPAQQQGPILASIIASEQTAERLWHGGEASWIRNLEQAGFQRRP